MAVYGKMSQNRKLYWRGVYVLLVWMLIVLRLQVITGKEEEEDKVCYMKDTTSACKTHRLNGCESESEIAIIYLGYAYTTNCTCLSGRCTKCRFDGGTFPLESTASCRDEYYDADYWNVVSHCSKHKSCFYDVPNHRYYNECSSLTAFSHIRYRCVKKTYEINICSNQTQIGPYASLFFEEANLSNESINCVCNITVNSSDPAGKYNITALEIEMGGTENRKKSSLTLTSPSDGYEVKEDTIRPNTLILSTDVPLTTVVNLVIKGNNTPTRIWLLVKGTFQVQVTCETRIQHDAGKNISEADTTSVMLYGIIGGIFGPLVVVGLMLTFVVYFRRRRKVSIPNPTQQYESRVKMKRDAEHDYSLIEDIPSHPGVQHISGIPTSTGAHALSVEKDAEERYVDMEPDQQKLPGDTESDGVSTGRMHEGDTTEGDECYNVLNTTSEHTKSDANYDTMVSASKAVQAVSDQNYYSYDHLGNEAVLERTENDYDLISKSSQD